VGISVFYTVDAAGAIGYRVARTESLVDIPLPVRKTAPMIAGYKIKTNIWILFSMYIVWHERRVG
jgi:hypothetical protein